jgi:soluble lytic murein transglycosylase-like protein
MRTERVCAVLLAVALCGVATQPATAADPGSPYRLTIPAQEAYRLRDTRPYTLAPEFRRKTDKPAPAVSAELQDKPYSSEIGAAAREAALDPALLHALIHVESRYRENAVSPKGARGLMQVMPATAVRYGVTDPAASRRANLKAGTSYLRDLMRMFDDRLDLALAAYNAGEGAVQRHANRIPPYPETRQYVQDVLSKYEEWREAPDAAAAVRPAVTYLPGTRLVLPAAAPADRWSAGWVALDANFNPATSPAPQGE